MLLIFNFFSPLFQGITNLRLESMENLHLKGLNKLNALREFSRETELKLN